MAQDGSLSGMSVEITHYLQSILPIRSSSRLSRSIAGSLRVRRSVCSARDLGPPPRTR